MFVPVRRPAHAWHSYCGRSVAPHHDADCCLHARLATQIADAISLVREPAFDLSRRGALQRLAERGEDTDTEAARTIANVCAALMAAPAPASQ